jgi:hypothetical protein
VQFKEYLEEQNRLELELFESIHQEDPSWIDESVMDIVRGTGRVIKGVAQAGSGVMSMGDEALARAVGDGTKGRFKGGWSRFARGVGNIGSGVKQAVVGGPSAVPASSPNPVAQASSSVSSDRKPAPVSSQADPAIKKSQLKFKVGKEEKVESNLQSLINQYKVAKSGGERNRILAVIAMRHPKWYQEKLSQARSRQTSRVAPAV